ncbi:Uma2 family endonuclease [Deinococcus arenicola]|uniref:Uma2 family endonuclease n=1 Tax=Deinococcus arenicola TaxID=2994950 RepID=A0ABU4DM13_9DEIO|nr:Uma2 family endonuclease [Deinococcus sp. ZS9-10]MDV6373467.1 Uma2 family endonuclease [Deinococcus sp. ZS9-10]
MDRPDFKAMSVEEYLRTEELSSYKREYVGGFVYPLHGQAGVGMPHSLISGNILASLHGAAQKAGCRIHQSDMRLSLEASSTYFYPDVMLVCDTTRTQRLAETAPCLLVEILSPSTAANDRVGKYAMYTAISSLQTYLIVEQDERRVYVYQRDGDGWNLTELAGSGEVNVPCLGRRLSLNEIYGGVLEG